MPFVASKLSTNQLFCGWVKNAAGDMVQSGDYIKINGGYGMALPQGSGGVSIVDQAVLTEVSQESLEVLRLDPTFIQQENAGWFIVHSGKSRPSDPGTYSMAPGMDGSAQTRESDFSESSPSDGAAEAVTSTAKPKRSSTG